MAAATSCVDVDVQMGLSPVGGGGAGAYKRGGGI